MEYLIGPLLIVLLLSLLDTASSQAFLNGDVSQYRPYSGDVYAPVNQPPPGPMLNYYNGYPYPQYFPQTWNPPMGEQNYASQEPADDQNPDILPYVENNVTDVADIYADQTNKTNSEADNDNPVRGLFSKSKDPILHFGFANVNGKNVIDESEQGFAGVLDGQVTMQQLSPVCGFGLHFQNGGLSVNPAKLSDLVKKEMSVVTWVKIKTVAHPNTVYSSSGPGTEQRLVIQEKKGTFYGLLHWSYKLDGGSKVIFDIKTDAVITPGIWAHIGAAYDGSKGKLKMFINGKKVITTSDVGKVDKISWGQRLVIGKFPDASGADSTSFFEGYLDEFYLFDDVQDESDIDKLMAKCDFPTGDSGLAVHYTFDDIQGVSIIDSSTKAINAEIVGKFEQIQFSPKCHKGIVIEGAQGHFKLDSSKLDSQNSNSMTIAVWIRLSTNDKVSTIYGCLGAKGVHHLTVESTGTPNAFVHWLHKSPDGKVVFDVSTDPAVPAGIWTHLAVVYNGGDGKLKIFVDGVKILTTSKGVNKEAAVPWSSPVTIGTFIGNKEALFQGAMEEFYVFTTNLMQVEVEALMEKCEFPPDKILYYVDVTTGAESKSGTPSRVFIKLIGEKGEYGEEELGDNFQQGSARPFNVYAPDIGNPVKISIRKDTKGIISTDWYLEKVVITVDDRTDGPTFIFNCNCWIGKDKKELQKYLIPEKNVDGVWSPWSQWGGCGAGLCGGNKKVRTRSCTDPPPSGGGKPCPGNSFEEGTCPVDGGWGAWGSWSACSKTCGGAAVTRERKCDNPEPQNNGKPCDPAKAKETKTDCNQPCETGPVNGQWSEWSEWSACAKSCGGSVVTRTRSCNNPPPDRGGEDCLGEASETAYDCVKPCPVPGKWGEWKPWSECSATCGTGTKVRTRECDSPAPEYGGECTGTGQETAQCVIRECAKDVVNGQWGEWGPWGTCSETEICNRGSQIRERKCNNPEPKNGGELCPGTGSESQECPTANCKAVPDNTAASKIVDPKSFIGQMCNATTAELVTEPPSNDLLKAVTVSLPKIAPSLSSGYFAINNNSYETKELCFEPKQLMTVAQLAQLYPSFSSAKSMPFSPRPGDQEHIKGVKVSLRADKALHGVEFLLGFSSTYAPTDTVSLEDVRFLFQVLPGSEKIVAHGYNRVGDTLFAVYASLGDGDNIVVEGESSGTMSSAEIEAALAPPAGEEKTQDPIIDITKRQSIARNDKRSSVTLERLDQLRGAREGGLRGSLGKMVQFANEKHSTIAPTYIYEPIHELQGTTGMVDQRKGTMETLWSNSSPFMYQPPQSISVYNDDSPSKVISQKVFALLKRVGLGLVTISDLSIGMKASMSELILRVSGKAAPKGIGGWFNFEIVRKDIFAVGFTAEQAAFVDFTEKLFNKKIALFEKLQKTSFGISFAQKGFKVSPETKFNKEPLQSLLKKQVPDGLFFAARTKFPADCEEESFCKFGQILMGKETWLKFTGNVNQAGVKVEAGAYDIPIKGDLRFNKVEIFIEVKFGTAPPVPNLGFAVELNVPVKGEVDESGKEVPGQALQLGGKLFLTGAAEIGTTLYMNGMWKKAFGLSYLNIGNIQIGLTITLAAGIPTEFKFNGRLEIGVDCQGADDFKENGRCISGEAFVGVSANPDGQYIYGELSSVTIGKVLRMLGSKLQLPPAVEKSGFPKGLVISASWKGQKVPYAGSTKTIKKGVYIKGTINILGFAPAVEILLNDQEMNFDFELAPLKLLGGVEVVRSLKDKKNGPKFYLHAKRNPLNAEIFLQGAVVIFGFETEIMFKLKPESIEAEVALNLFSVFQARVWISAGYGNPFSGTGFSARFIIETGFDVLAQKTAEVLVQGLQAARKALQSARERIKEAKEACERKAASFCDICEKLACDKVKEECQRVMDKFKHYVGEKIDKFGRRVKNLGQKFKSGFKLERTKRYMDLLASKLNCHSQSTANVYTDKFDDHVTSCHSNSTRTRSARSKRFVGKMMCEKLAEKACKVSKDLCKGSCNVAGHITKGMCKSLDIAQLGLYALEKGASWAEQAVVATAKNILVIHNLTFETHITAKPLDSTVSLGADVTIFGSKLQIKIDFNLADPLKNVHKLADTALQFFKKLFSPRFSKTVYDKPSEETDFEFSGNFRIQRNGTTDCLSAPSNSKAGSPVTLGSCDGQVSEWLFTLTGALMNLESGLCLTAGTAQGQETVQQEICDAKSDAQRFTCNGTKITSVQDKTLCVTASAGKSGSGDVEARLLKCDDESAQDEQHWVLHGDSRPLSICDKFVPDVALGKPALQSSLLAIDQIEDVSSDEKGPSETIPGVGPELAVDGNMSSVPSAGSCSMTSLEVDPWWRVDLQKEHIVTDVNVVSSSGPLARPLHNFEIRVGILTDHKQNPMCGDRVRQLAPGEIWTSECKPPIAGRHVSVSMVGKGYLAICEVAVFARLDNEGKCSAELSSKRHDIANVSPQTFNSELENKLFDT